MLEPIMVEACRKLRLRINPEVEASPARPNDIFSLTYEDYSS
jgi:hypothetical protein